MIRSSNTYYICKTCESTLQNPGSPENIDEFMKEHPGHGIEISKVNFLFDLGYNDLKKAEELLAVAKSIGATVADVRFQPDTRNPEFSRKHLVEILGDGYVHIGELGNQNYKGNGEIQLADADKGIEKLHSLLLIKPVIIICACWKRSECHRLHVSHEYNIRYGVSSLAVTRSDAKAILTELKKENNPQMSLL